MAKLVDKTYGDALFELAVENGQTDAYFSECQGILQIIEENQELVKLLTHPKISKDEKLTVIENVFKGRVSDDITGFLVLIVKKDRQAELTDILSYFIDRVKEYKKIGVAYVTTAVTLSDTEKKSVVDKLTATTNYDSFEMNYSVDKDIIGGMIIRIGDRVLDSSIKSKIESMAKELYEVRLTSM
ncbi:MAG: F0F1 ATP synthase subunit delta [Lachnospiraceae bacterium]|nr:F0F1 ATP synthase subunit delta [Lachnospiraceae bacterium]